MTPRPALHFFPPDEAASWRRIRRWAVPRWMIEQATERRLAGDWRGALAAAHVDVAFDPSAVARECGAETAAALADDLRHLAPDLLRWHLPRVLHGRSTLATGRTVTLARYGGQALRVATPPMTDGPQRLTLRFGPEDADRPDGTVPNRELWVTARHLWDARRTAELHERCGGGRRVPFFHPDGTALTGAELPAGEPTDDDPAARAEWATLLHERGEVVAAFVAAGVELDPTSPEPSRRHRVDALDLLSRLPLALTRLGAEARRLVAATGAPAARIVSDWRASVLLEPTGADGPLRARVVDRDSGKDAVILPEALWRRLPDLELLRRGGAAPQRLHPLVRAALFPDCAVTDGPAGPPDPEPLAPVAVRCRGEWHQVASADGGLRMPHSELEQQRERAMRAFGGAVAGCFAVQQTWTTGSGRLPRALRAQLRELFERAQHGDTPGVLTLLDAGVDPRVRDGGGRTLLHVLHLIDHERLLDRLLAAGVGLETADHRGRTPLYTAVNDGGSVTLVRALLAAGARTDVVDEQGLSLGDVIARYKRTDLRFLREQVERDHPDLGLGYWSDELTEDDS